MSRTSLTPQQLLAFYQQAEKLKTTLRHSWLNDGIRQESVAEHSWMMALMALAILPRITQQLDQHKVLQMIIVHDLAEAVTKDMPVWQGVNNKQKKAAAEKAAMHEIFSHLDAETRQELMVIWEEYELRKSPEALFVKALDTLDVIVQHNVAPLSTWDDNDYLWQLSPLQNSFFDVDEFFRAVKDEIDAWSIAKVGEAGQLKKLDQVELKKRVDHRHD